MPALQQHITPDTPMGATLVPGGATFRTRAPEAWEVYVVVQPQPDPYPKPASDLLTKDDGGHWTGFFPGLEDGALYRFYVVGAQVDRGHRQPPLFSPARTGRLQPHAPLSFGLPHVDD